MAPLAGAQQFGPETSLAGGLNGMDSVDLADLDGDGRTDMLVASSDDGKVVWYGNRGGGLFGTQRVVTAAAAMVRSVDAADLDGDGDADVLSASAGDDTIAWYENVFGNGTFGPQEVISSTTDVASVVRAGDFDGDGDADVVAGSGAEQTVAWFENTDGAGAFGSELVITSSAGAVWVLDVADLDSDGDIDIVAASFNFPAVFAWYENTDGAGSFGAPQLISSLANVATDIRAADVDGDGDQDIAAASTIQDQVAWYENADGAGGFAPKQVVASGVDGAWSVFAADVDGDGDTDLLSASRQDDTVAWYENTDGAGAFGPQQVVSATADGAAIVSAADLDGDGDTDVVSATLDTDELAWHANTDGDGAFVLAQIVGKSAPSAEQAVAADFDGDAGLDILFCTPTMVGWFQNDGYGGFGPQQALPTGANLTFDVAAADLDGDGDPDALSAALSALIGWYENADGLGGFGPYQVIAAGADPAHSVETADLDGDGDIDVLGTWNGVVPSDHEITWYENDGSGGFGMGQLVTSGAGDMVHVHAADLDGDADPDVLGAQYGIGQVAWYENLGGGAAFGSQQVISSATENAKWIRTADLDGDLDLDVVSASEGDTKLAWYENTDGLGAFGPQQVISTSSIGVRSVAPGDLDGDGDTDLATASFVDDTIAWYENLDGLGNFGPELAITLAADFASSVCVADLDSDGDADVISTSANDGKVAWYENLPCCVLEATTVSISLSAGGTQTYSLDAGTLNAFALYWLLGTTSGVSPGQPLPPTALKLPLNLDNFFLFTLLRPNVLVPSSLALLDAQGTAQTSLILPAGLQTSLAGIQFHHAYLLIDLPSLLGTYVSNPVPLKLLP